MSVESNPHIRDTLFGDVPFEHWASSETGEPWVSFKAAKEARARGDGDACVQILKDIVSREGLESRQYLQGWHFLKQFGVQPPPEKAKELLGIVVEVGMERGLDLLAAYPDFRARYYNFSGAAVIWERPDSSLDAPVQKLLDSATPVISKIGLWTQARPAEPRKGCIRINMLTPSGLHFGEGMFQALASDPLGGPMVTAATQLMQAMIKKTQKRAD
jgi:hypothetical protein